MSQDTMPVSGANNRHKRGCQSFTRMPIRTICFITTVLAGIVFAPLCGASEWVSYGVDATGDMQYDRDSMSWPSKDTVRVWTRLIHSDEGKKEYASNLQAGGLSKYNREALRNTDSLIEINCRTKEAKFLLTENYDTKGAPWRHRGPPRNLPSQWYAIVPGSVADKLCGIVCSPPATTASEGAKETTAPRPADASSSEPKRENWIRIYDDPGHQ